MNSGQIWLGDYLSLAGEKVKSVLYKATATCKDATGAFKLFMTEGLVFMLFNMRT